MKRRKRNKFEVYIESFIMTVSVGMTLSTLPYDVKDLEFPVHAEDDLVTIDATSEGVDLIVLEDKDIKVVVKEEVDSRINELDNTKVEGSVSPVVSGTITQLDEQASNRILDQQLEVIAEGMVDEEINSANYSGMKVSHEYENLIKKVCLEYSESKDVDYDLLYRAMMTIGYRESAGEWNNSGVKSKTDDVGVFQINKCNFKDAKERYGYTESDLRYDDTKNLYFACDMVCSIMKAVNCESEETLKRVWPRYNGGPKGESKKASINYGIGCQEIYNNYFGAYSNGVVR